MKGTIHKIIQLANINSDENCDQLVFPLTCGLGLGVRQFRYSGSEVAMFPNRGQEEMTSLQQPEHDEYITHDLSVLQGAATVVCSRFLFIERVCTDRDLCPCKPLSLPLWRMTTL